MSKRREKTFGQEIIDNLREVIDLKRSGKPVHQTIVATKKVGGKTVVTSRRKVFRPIGRSRG